MSRLASVFQISIYGLAALSSAILALAEDAWFPSSLGVPLALLALFLAERRNTLRLNSALANILGLLALLLASSELLGDNLEARLLSGAHLIVYLLWIVLFLEKGPRQYWWLLALSVLQVAVASVLTTEGWFGAVLVTYFFCAIWTLSVFTLFRSQQRFEVDEHMPEAEQAAAPAAHAGEPATLLTMSRMLRGSGSVRGSIQSDSHERWVNLRFALGTIGWAFLAIGVAMVFFVMIPRVWIGRGLTSEREDAARLASPVTGFTEQVRLGDFGTILESTEKVMEVRVFDGRTEEPIDVAAFAARLGYDEPLFRGAVLTGYSDGRWQTDTRFLPSFLRSDRRSRSGAVRQEFRLQPIGTSYLFAIHPLQSCRVDGYRGGARLNGLTSTLTLPDGEAPRSEVSYTVWSTATQMQTPLIAGPGWESGPQIVRALFGRRPRGLERLGDLARQVAGESEETSDEEKARRLMAFLRDSGEYGYSLNASIQNAQIDPIEDFLFYRKQGHCEYFASAMTLMLRAVDVPARLVSGFKGGTLNRFTGSYEVEQRHAHAWVEAFLNNQWVVLDPTPSTERTQSVSSLGPRISTWREFTSLMSGLWGRHVVGMSLTRQRDELYRPLAEAVRNWWESIREGRIQTSDIAAGLVRLLTSPERWFSWQGGAVTFALLLLLSGFVWIVRRAWRLLRRVRARYRLHARQRLVIEFYERFRGVCEACGVRREPSQTQREHAAGAARELNALLPAVELDGFPNRLVDAFYRIRFGEEEPDSGTMAEIDERLSELERSIRERGAGTPRPNGAATLR